MSFNSIEYLIFFPIVLALYFAFEHKYRWLILLIASCIFYMSWNWHYIFLILFSALIDYFVAIKIGEITNKQHRKLYLYLSLVTNLGLLFVFKYFNFFISNVETFLQSLSCDYLYPHLQLLLPVGISFYTFQALSYTIDVYRGIKKPEKHLGIFLLYITFFPQLVAGPIERSTRLIRQFYIKQSLKYENISQGLRHMLWGFMKKIVIADHLAIYVNQVYNHLGDYHGFTIIIATLFFAFQIYCDFSGYSDIAIGTARLFGIDLMKNFHSPYLARSVREFWKRWHISLSTWFKDYVYIPLGGNRLGPLYWYRNIFLVFVISGIWHGANWTFVLWGTLHGSALILEAMTVKWRHALYEITHLNKFGVLLNSFKRVVCFGFILLTWTCFRANNLQDLGSIAHKIIFDLNYRYFKITVESFDFNFAIVSILLLVALEALHNKYNLVERFARLGILERWVSYAILVVLILLFSGIGTQEFIYFQF